MSPEKLMVLFLSLLQLLLLTVGFFRYGSHPDELGYRVFDIVAWDKWRPINYYYPTTHQYFLKAITILVADVGHFVLHLFPDYDVRLFNYIGRLITAAMAVGCSLLAYAIARTAGHSKVAAIVYMVLFSTFPLLNNLGRFNTTDVPNLFWLMLSMWVTLLAAADPTAKRVLIAGVVAGLAIGVKYLAVLGVPGFLTALVLRQLQSAAPRAVTKTLLYYLAAMAIGFLISTPLAVLDFQNFVTDLKFLNDKVPVWSGKSTPIAAIGIPLLILKIFNPVLILCMLYGLLDYYRKVFGPLGLIVGSTALIYYIFLATSHFYPLRFLLPLFAMLLLLAGQGISRFLDSLQQHRAGWFRKIILITCISVGNCLQFRESAAVAYNFVHETRYHAANYVKQRLLPGDTVAFPLSSHTYFPTPYLAKDSIFDTDAVKINGKPEVPASVVFGMTSSLYDPNATGPAEAFQQYMRSNWTEVKVFKMRPLWGVSPVHTEFLAPTIKIYEAPQVDQ